jgi:L-fucose mutarotase
MLKYTLLHPEILEALGRAGHGAKVVIADANYPFSTRTNPSAQRVYLNVAPGLVNATDVLRVLVDAIPIECAEIAVNDDGVESTIIDAFRQILPAGTPITSHRRYAFYNVCLDSSVALVIATGEQRTFSNIVLTIGVVTS